MEETTSVGKAVSESVARIGTVFLIYLFVFIFAAFAGYLIGNWLLGGYVFIGELSFENELRLHLLVFGFRPSVFLQMFVQAFVQE